MDIRPFREADRYTVMSLAERLVTGTAPWRDQAAVVATVRRWVAESVGQYDPIRRPVLVAEEAGAVVGFVCGSERRHWSGEVDAYVGELVVADTATGRGVGRRLMAAIEEWARTAGYGRLTLKTGAANQRARTFYATLGYHAEDVVLTRALR